MNPDAYTGDAALSPVYSRRQRGGSSGFEGSDEPPTSFPGASFPNGGYNSPKKANHVATTLFEMNDGDADNAANSSKVADHPLHPHAHRRGSNSKDPRGFKKYRFITMIIASLLAMAGILYYLSFGISGEINGVADMVDNNINIQQQNAGDRERQEQVHNNEIPVLNSRAEHEDSASAKKVVMLSDPPLVERSNSKEQIQEQPLETPKEIKEIKLNMEAVNEMTPEDLEANALEDIERIRTMKKEGVVIETNAEAQILVKQVQDVLRVVLEHKYGKGPYQIAMELEFPDSLIEEGEPSLMLPDGTVSGADDSMREATIIFELAPAKFVPYSVYFFLENIVHDFNHGAFHRNAGHVLQAMFRKHEGADSHHTNFAWQEYSHEFPHKQYTLGFAGRPSGSSAIYISTLDNTDNHGPASQGSKTEADATLGKLASPESIQIVKRMLKQKGGKPAGFVTDPHEHIRIMGLRLMEKYD